MMDDRRSPRYDLVPGDELEIVYAGIEEKAAVLVEFGEVAALRYRRKCRRRKLERVAERWQLRYLGATRSPFAGSALDPAFDRRELLVTQRQAVGKLLAAAVRGRRPGRHRALRGLVQDVARVLLRLRVLVQPKGRDAALLVTLQAVLLQEGQHVVVVRDGRRGLVLGRIGRLVVAAGERQHGHERCPEDRCSTHARVLLTRGEPARSNVSCGPGLFPSRGNRSLAHARRIASPQPTDHRLINRPAARPSSFSIRLRSPPPRAATHQLLQIARQPLPPNAGTASDRPKLQRGARSDTRPRSRGDGTEAPRATGGSPMRVVVIGFWPFLAALPLGACASDAEAPHSRSAGDRPASGTMGGGTPNGGGGRASGGRPAVGGTGAGGAAGSGASTSFGGSSPGGRGDNDGGGSPANTPTGGAGSANAGSGSGGADSGRGSVGSGGVSAAGRTNTGGGINGAGRASGGT